MVKLPTNWELKQQTCFSQFLEAGKSKIKVLTDPESGERTLHDLEMATFPLVLKEVVENKDRNLMPPPLFIRTLMPFIRAANEQITSQSPPPNTIMLGMRLSIRILGDHKHSVNSTSNLQPSKMNSLIKASSIEKTKQNSENQDSDPSPLLPSEESEVENQILNQFTLQTWNPNYLRANS